MIGDSIEIDEPHTDGIELTVDTATLRSVALVQARRPPVSAIWARFGREGCSPIPH
jgi:hypothetical protein